MPGSGSPTRRPPGKYRGNKLPLTADQYRKIRSILRDLPFFENLAGWDPPPKIYKGHRDLALFSSAVGSSLRASDLLALRLADVIPMGEFKPSSGFEVLQRKTGVHLWIDLSETVLADLTQWIHSYRKAMGSLHESLPLWPAFNGVAFHPRALSYPQYVALVKSWVGKVNLDPRRYGTHSLRSTLPAHYYQATADALGAQALFGHRRLATTEVYLREVAKGKASDIRKADLLEGAAHLAQAELAPDSPKSLEELERLKARLLAKARALPRSS